MDALLLPFSELCDRLAAATRKLEKRALIAVYLGGLAVEDAARAALYMAGQPFAETDQRNLNVGGSLLSKAVAAVSGADDTAMHAAYRRHGDLGAAAADLLAGRVPSPPPLTLAEVESQLAEMAAVRGPAPRLQLMTAMLKRSAAIEAKYLVKLCSGDMRTGVKQSLVEDAVAAAYRAEPAAVRRAVMLNGSLPEVVRMAAEGTLAEARMKLFHPLGFMLASPADSVEDALERFREELAEEAAATGDGPSAEKPALTRAQVEDKYDGMRAQLHCEGGRVAIFSRNREEIGPSFPELTEAFAGIAGPVILDGEVLAWNLDRDRALSFSTLQQRLGRKRVTPQMRESAPVVFMAFDLLFQDGELLLDVPLAERRQRLEAFAAAHAGATARHPAGGQVELFSAGPALAARLRLAPASRLENAAHLEQAYADARARGNEGVMLKALGSHYQPGRRGLAWLKLKRELATLDVVVTGAEYGNGRRALVLSDYTFAVRDGDGLKNVGKAYSGLTDAEIDELSAFFKAHTIEDYGGFRTVEPLLVLEVAFNNVMRSTRHASGFALRFPRIVRIRRDKPVAEADTLARVEEIYQSQPDKPVEMADSPEDRAVPEDKLTAE